MQILILLAVFIDFIHSKSKAIIFDRFFNILRPIKAEADSFFRTEMWNFTANKEKSRI